jgi:hypothetical protein
MNSKKSYALRFVLLLSLMAGLTALSGRMKADTGNCGGGTVSLPFTDVPSSNPFFCSVAAVFFSGLTSGTSATTFSPGANVTREQMAAFITRTLDQSLRRGSQRAALNQWWTTTPHYDLDLGAHPIGAGDNFVCSDGENVWVSDSASGEVCAVRASTGQELGIWSGATGAMKPLAAMSRVFVCGNTSPGSLYMLNPGQPPGTVTAVAQTLGNGPRDIAFDGRRLWTANANSVSIITPLAVPPWSVVNPPTSFNSLRGILYDGANIWVTDQGAGTLLKLNASGAVLSTTGVGVSPQLPVFDGVNIWVPNATSSSVTVVRVRDSAGSPLATPIVLTTLTGNGLNNPTSAAFDGERILITNSLGNSVSLFQAANLTPIGSLPTGGGSDFPTGSCSDGLQFWITLNGVDKLARF